MKYTRSSAAPVDHRAVAVADFAICVAFVRAALAIGVDLTNVLHFAYPASRKAEAVQSRWAHPTILRLLTWLCFACALALTVIAVAPLLNAFGYLYDIVLMLPFVSWMIMVSVAVIVVSVPLAWALGLAGLTLEALTRFRSKRKRKRKRDIQPGSFAATIKISRESARPDSAGRRLRRREFGVAKYDRLSERAEPRQDGAAK